jgi:hypothetical protein
MNAINKFRNFGMVAMYFVSNKGHSDEPARQTSAEEREEERELVRLLEQLKRMERRGSGRLTDTRPTVTSTAPTRQVGFAGFAG